MHECTDDVELFCTPIVDVESDHIAIYLRSPNSKGFILLCYLSRDFLGNSVTFKLGGVKYNVIVGIQDCKD